MPWAEGETTLERYDLVCFSHLRWDFVFQRPQHLLSRIAQTRRVFFIEEPMAWTEGPAADVMTPCENVYVIRFFLKPEQDRVATQARLLDRLLTSYAVEDFVCWYYTPMALPFSRHLRPRATVFDCMDALTGFKDCPPELAFLEDELLQRADVVFTGGRSLHEARIDKHENIHLFPSSVDTAHFGTARGPLEEPSDQEEISYPRIGYFGVIDERLDTDLLRVVAERRPEWQFVMVGPVAKIDPQSLPVAKNIHYLGMKAYDELPAYIAHWNVAMLPFRLDGSTRFISPTKVPEYLAAGRPVVSTAIPDVVEPYGREEFVAIASHPTDFEARTQELLSRPAPDWLLRVDRYLADASWDSTCASMELLIDRAVRVGHRSVAVELMPAARAGGESLA